MPLFRVTVKTSKNTNGIRIERGMSADIPSCSMSNPVTVNGGLNMAYLDVARIG